MVSSGLRLSRGGQGLPPGRLGSGTTAGDILLDQQGSAAVPPQPRPGSAAIARPPGRHTHVPLCMRLSPCAHGVHGVTAEADHRSCPTDREQLAAGRLTGKGGEAWPGQWKSTAHGAGRTALPKNPAQLGRRARRQSMGQGAMGSSRVMGGWGLLDQSGKATERRCRELGSGRNSPPFGFLLIPPHPLACPLLQLNLHLPGRHGCPGGGCS